MFAANLENITTTNNENVRIKYVQSSCPISMVLLSAVSVTCAHPWPSNIYTVLSICMYMGMCMHVCTCACAIYIHTHIHLHRLYFSGEPWWMHQLTKCGLPKGKSIRRTVRWLLVPSGQSLHVLSQSTQDQQQSEPTDLHSLVPPSDMGSGLQLNSTTCTPCICTISLSSSRS